MLTRTEETRPGWETLLGGRGCFRYAYSLVDTVQRYPFLTNIVKSTLEIKNIYKMHWKFIDFQEHIYGYLEILHSKRNLSTYSFINVPVSK